MALHVGNTAPDFTVKDHKGNVVRLSSFKGVSPVVLIFYPGDETPGCTIQLCSARDDYDKYREAGVEVFGVNQADQEKHTRFVARHKLKTPLLVDRNYAVSEKYDALMKLGPLRLINRTVVGIDTEGKIVFYKRGMPATAEILSSFKVAKA
ncbi:peroxiredoxin [Candidatus Chlorohelix sp.]|uniref:peroxiredoxin n=1 Tax=Candidatus Chlorohelix sp. TaxID=3139201 RepID=UPI00302C9D7C